MKLRWLDSAGIGSTESRVPNAKERKGFTLDVGGHVVAKQKREGKAVSGWILKHEEHRIDFPSDLHMLLQESRPDRVGEDAAVLPSEQEKLSVRHAAKNLVSDADSGH